MPQKAAKIQKSGARTEDAENEVSSSSEAETIPKVPTKVPPSPDQKAAEKRRGLDRFVQSTQQLEVSTSSEHVVDLTSEDQETPAGKVDGGQKIADATTTSAEKAKSTVGKAEASSQEVKQEGKGGKNKDALKTTQHESKEVECESEKKEKTEGAELTKDSEQLTEKTKVDDCDTLDETLNSTMDTSDVVSQSLNESTETNDDSDDAESEGKEASPATPSTPGGRTLKRVCQPKVVF